MTKKPFIKRIPAWSLSLITAFVSLILIFIFAGIFTVVFNLLGISDYVDDSIAAYFCYGVAVALACFLICKAHPTSFWYVPIICNAVSITGALVEPNFWITAMWIAYGTGWILSLIGTILGVLHAKRGLAKENTQ
jgi:hypothetical protein